LGLSFLKNGIVFRKWDGGEWNGLIRHITGDWTFKRGNEISVPIKCGGISRIVLNGLISEEGLCFVEWV
jgi:hypothetical protein